LDLITVKRFSPEKGLLLDKVPPTQNASASNEESMYSTLSAQVNSFLLYTCTMQNVRQSPRFQDLSRQGWSSLECACALEPSRRPHFHLIISSHDAKMWGRIAISLGRLPMMNDEEWIMTGIWCMMHARESRKICTYMHRAGNRDNHSCLRRKCLKLK
jgi:hypothetical protein